MVLSSLKIAGHCLKVVSAVFNRVFEDIELPDFEVWYNEASDVARVNIAGNDMTAGRNPAGQPLRRRSIATSNLEAAPPGLKTKLLDMAAVERVEQFCAESIEFPRCAVPRPNPGALS
jgi:hypothetical protein